MNSRRSRNGRNGGKRSYGSGNNRSFESNGPDVKVRGTANQVFDKYIALARDATAAGDRIAAEGYFQHAEHYFRVYTEANQARQVQQQSQRQSDAGNGASGERERGESREEQVAASVATESKDTRETELSELDVTRSEPN